MTFRSDRWLFGFGCACLFLPTAFARAAASEKPRQVPASFCELAPAIASKVEQCDDNDKFAQAGEACLDKLDAEVARVAAELAGQFAKESAQKQSAKLHSSFEDYGLSSAQLAYLIATARLAEQEVSAYSGALDLPEDSEETDVNGGDELAYANGVECYGETKKSIESIVLDLQFERKKLEAAKKIADGHAATSAAREKGLDAGMVAAPIVSGGQSRGAAPKPGIAGKAKNPASDITGVKEDQAKQRP